mmetsp:Transcript_19125/g.32863  ORF Transcript_19125/g.32863 Transcript_19125/m.32863 type:complete len:267 (-) Transcript_19125:349-1149(-)|eukprot:CAMPEP_0119102468 /NCGR_PEP_ID=MMETSP1180-20130426/1203_1 /TAXON_ID=3052 ORGANISM="Chlamydomonas cf sp, Strain CCMP681" /NCGR_SAMPLE_ID=MMETSP1180 /ASSEMBLY_ACC=CAM_ASM_000741 /LENGTH=266 /DNA_ID=CAMNT_0007086763 /DNA_START=64 /DNA_END=864 /DNA_ORIENTATION=+
MFEALLEQGSTLKRLVEALKELVAEVNFDVTTEGIKLQAMDSSHVCLISFELEAAGFKEFRCDRPMSMGIQIANLFKILKCSGNDDSITLKAEDNGDVLTLMFENLKKDKSSDFDLKLLTIESEQLSVPDQSYHAIISMPSAEYKRIVGDLATIGDTVLVSVTKAGVRFSSSGDIGSANMNVRPSMENDKPEECTTINIEEPVALTFALRYLNNFAKATALSPLVTLSLCKDMPIRVTYEMEGLGSVKYFLAPKIEDADEMDGEDA